MKQYISKKRKATLPVGGANKKVIESATSSPTESRENTDDEMLPDIENRQEGWESELMLNNNNNNNNIYFS